MTIELPSDMAAIDREIEQVKARVIANLELPDAQWIRQSGPFPSVQHFFDSSFKNFKELLSYTRITPSHRVLDYGCGLARLAIPMSGYLAGPDSYYCGVDTDQSCIDRNRRVFGKLKNFRFEHVNLYSKMYNRKGHSIRTLAGRDFGSPFNLVFLFSVFTHILPDDFDFLLEFLKSQLEPAGEIFSTFFILNDKTQAAINAGKAHRNFATELGGARIDNPDVPEGAVAYYEHDVIERFRRAGFSDIQIHYGKWRGTLDSWIWQDIVVAQVAT